VLFVHFQRNKEHQQQQQQQQQQQETNNYTDTNLQVDYGKSRNMHSYSRIHRFEFIRMTQTSL
jgi:hypothetical protein